MIKRSILLHLLVGGSEAIFPVPEFGFPLHFAGGTDGYGRSVGENELEQQFNATLSKIFAITCSNQPSTVRVPFHTFTASASVTKPHGCVCHTRLTHMAVCVSVWLRHTLTHRRIRN